MAFQSGQKVRELRLERGLSQIELARRVGISRQALGAIEGNEYQPGVAVALNLAEELATTVEALFGRQKRNSLVVECSSGRIVEPDTRVSLARVAGRLVAVPVPSTCVTLTVVRKNSKGLMQHGPSVCTRGEVRSGRGAPPHGRADRSDDAGVAKLRVSLEATRAARVPTKSAVGRDYNAPTTTAEFGADAAHPRRSANPDIPVEESRSAFRRAHWPAGSAPVS